MSAMLNRLLGTGGTSSSAMGMGMGMNSEMNQGMHQGMHQGMNQGMDTGMGGGSYYGSSPSRTFTIAPSPHDSTILLVTPASYAPTPEPLYSVKQGDTHISAYYNPSSTPPSQQLPVATINLASPSKQTELVVRNQRMAMSISSMSGSCTVSSPWGQFKWKLNQMTGSSWELYDGAGTRWAKYKSASSAGMPGGAKKLEVLVECDDFFVEMMLLAIVFAKMKNKKVNEAAGEIFMAVAGA